MTNNILDHNNKQLSIQVRLDGLSFFIQDINTKNILEYGDHDFTHKVDPARLTQELLSFYEVNPTLKQKFKKVNVVYSNQLFTLVPKDVFQEDKAPDYLKFNTKLLATDYVAHDFIDSLQVVCVYIPYTNSNNLFFDLYGSFEYHHSISRLLTKASLMPQNSDNYQVLIHIAETFFEISIIRGKELILANSFEFNTPEDFIYYLLFTMEQLELNPDSIPITVTGLINKEDPIYKMIYTYVRTINILEDTTLLPLKNNFTLSSLL